MIAFEKKVFAWIEQHGLVAVGATVVAAVSGGADSLALLHFLHRHKDRLRITVVAAHLNHCLRGAASAADRGVVQAYCNEWHIPLFSGERDVRQWAEEQGEHNTEAAARAVRYGFLRQVADICGGAVIATAHHLDDQSETIFMHLLRGSGLQGLCGMAPYCDGVIRPFLSVSKAEILSYCETEGLSYCTDESNLDTDYLRNHLRLNVLPYLTQSHPNLTQSLWNLGEICRGEHDYLTEQTEAIYEAINPRIGSVDGEFSAAAFFRLPLALQRRVVQYFFRMFQAKQGRIGAETLSFAQVEQIRSLAPGEQLVLPGNVRCERQAEQFVFSRLQRRKEGSVHTGGFSYPLAEIQEQVRLPFSELGFALEILAVPDGEQPFAQATVVDSHCLYLPAAVGRDMTLRSRRAGDHFAPQSMVGSMKLKKYLINEKIPLAQRELVPLLAREGEIFWVIPGRFGRIDALTGEKTAGAQGGWYIRVVYSDEPRKG